MDVRSKFIALGLYVVLGGITVIVAYAAVHYFEPEVASHSQIISLAYPPAYHAPSNRGGEMNLDHLFPRGDELSNSGQQQIALLKQMLDEKTTMLREKAALLQKRTTEFEALKRQYDDAVALAIELMAKEYVVDIEAMDDQQRKALEAQLNDARRRQSQLASELEALKGELAEADLEIAILRDDADREVADLFRSELVLQAAAADAIVRTGAAAVPALLELLKAESSDVRRWSARVLGEMGPAAADAVPALNAATNDEDPGVRNAAVRAVVKITEAR